MGVSVRRPPTRACTCLHSKRDTWACWCAALPRRQPHARMHARSLSLSLTLARARARSLSLSHTHSLDRHLRGVMEALEGLTTASPEPATPATAATAAAPALLGRFDGGDAWGGEWSGECCACCGDITYCRRCGGVDLCMRIDMHIYMCICTYARMYIYVHICMSMHIYAYTCKHM